MASTPIASRQFSASRSLTTGFYSSQKNRAEVCLKLLTFQCWHCFEGLIGHGLAIGLDRSPRRRSWEVRASSKIRRPKKPSGSTGTRRAGSGIQRFLSTLGCRYLVSQHSSRRVCTFAGTLQSSCGKSCIGLVGNKWILAGELLLSLRAEGYGGFMAVSTRMRGSEIFVNFLVH